MPRPRLPVRHARPQAYDAAVPELPEVETIRAQLAERLTGRTLSRVEILDPRLTRPYDLFEVAEELEGDRVLAVERRGKYLVVRLESGLALLVHLRMTGSFGFAPTSHERAVLELDDGSRLSFRDVRRFGTWLVLDGSDAREYLSAKNGPEPLGATFTTRRLASSLARRKAPLKAVLLDQRVVAGLGNIYADEALWRARLSPLRQANGLAPNEVRRLHRAIRVVLETGIDRQGSTLRDYATPDGAGGSMQDEFRVYGREGRPCPRCRTPIEKTRVGGRGTWFCPRCQPETDTPGA
jgi:formamidopyrimidine-DNA glycosylase